MGWPACFFLMGIGGPAFCAGTLVPKTADQTVLRDTGEFLDTELLYPLVANKKYSFFARLAYKYDPYSGTPTSILRLKFPTGVVGVTAHGATSGTSATSISDPFVQDQTVSTHGYFKTSSSAAGETAPGWRLTGHGISGQIGFLIVQGHILNGPNAGNFQFAWELTGGTGGCTIRALGEANGKASMMIVEEIA